MLSFTLEAVGVTPVPHVFPATASCSGCGGILMIDYDYSHQGFWLACDRCNARGNLVEFAAGIWKCAADDACARLRTALPAAVSKWLDGHLSDAKMRLQTLHLFDNEWTRALVDDDSGLNGAIVRRGLDIHGPSGADHLSHVIYACDAKTLRDAVVERPSITDRRRVASAHGNYLLVPVWDRPARAVGALAARSANDEETFIRTKPASDEGGLFFAQLLPEKDPDFWITIFAKVDDPWRVAQLHFEGRRSWGQTSLPLAGISTVMASPTYRFRWGGRPIILWSDRPTVAAIALAQRLGTKLAIVPYSANAQMSPRSWLRQVAKNARDWRRVFQELVVTGSPETLADAVRELDLYTADARQIADDWDAVARDRLLGATRNAIRCVNWLYEEHAGVLLRSNTAGVVEVVSHHTVRVDQVIRTPHGYYYRGRIGHRTGEVSFTEPAERFTRNANWIDDSLLRAGVTPGDIPSARKWREVSYVVKRLGPPAHIDGVRTLGWVDALGVFVFDAFQMRPNGACEESMRPDWLGPARPTIGLLPPGPLPPVGLRELLTGHPSLVYLIAAIVARIIAPALGYRLPPLALVGDNSARAARLAHLMGCSMPADWHRKAPATLGWACVVTGTRQQKRKAAKLLRKASATIAVVTPLELTALSVHKPWQRLRCPARSLPPVPIPGSEAEEVLQRMIPAFLAHLCAKYRIGGLPRHRGGLLARVYKALVSWLYSQPGTEGIQAPQLRLHIGPESATARATECFATMLRALVDEKDIRVVPPQTDGKPVDAAEVVLLPDGSAEFYWLAVDKIVRRRSAIPVSWKRLGKALTEASVITSSRRPETHSTQDQPEVWTLARSWWQANVAGPLAARKTH